MLYDSQERQILNKHQNTLAHQLLMIDISAKKLRREIDKTKTVKVIAKVLDMCVMWMSRLIKNY